MKLLGGDVRVEDLDEDRTYVAELVEAGLVSNEFGTLHLSIPAFTEREDRVLYPAVMELSTLLAEESHRPALAELDQVLDGLGYERLRSQYEGLNAYTASKIAGYCVETLVENRSLAFQLTVRQHHGLVGLGLVMCDS